MIAMGAGGLDVAVAMGGGPFYLKMPEIVNVYLTGKLRPFVTAKDVILEVLRILSVKGGVGRIIEYGGPGVASLSVPERATITNMGAELGATCSLFPSDARTKEFLKWQKRGKVFRKLEADKDAKYSKVIKINLSKLVPLIAQPHQPDNVIEVSKLKGIKVNQVNIGSCTNSSLADLTATAKLLKGRSVHPNVSMTISPGSKQVFNAISSTGALTDIIASGARILESACGPCIGMGQAPSTGAVTVRSFNRNFLGRSGTKSAKVYLGSPETCVAAAVNGEITDPRKLKKYPKIVIPKTIKIDDSGIIAPSKKPANIKIVRGPNIAPLPLNKSMPNSVKGEVLLKVGDNITTDHIMPAGAKVLPLRSNIPKISEHVYTVVDPEFPARAKAKGGGFIIGGDNYGQGSSREHAALAPMYLGVKMVVTKSFARIHLANLINFGILPATFENAADYSKIKQGDVLEIPNMKKEISKGDTISVINNTQKLKLTLKINLNERQRRIILAGGLLNYTKKGGK
jgi:aconitate hydratase